MNAIMHNTILEDTDSIIQQVQTESIREGHEGYKQGRAFLKLSLGRAREKRGEKIKKAAEGIRAKGDENKLKKRIALLAAQKSVKRAESYVKNCFASMKNRAAQQERLNQRVMTVINDMDEGRTRKTSSAAERAEQEQRFEGLGDEGAASVLKAEIGQMYDNQKSTAIKRSIDNEKVVQNIEGQKGGAEKTLKAMKKQKLFAGLFKAFSTFVAAAVSVLTAGAASPLGMAIASCSRLVQAVVPSLIQNGVNAILQVTGVMGSKFFEDQAKAGQDTQKNGAAHLERLVENMADEEKFVNHSERRTQNMINNLEQAVC
ncbi:MAG: hypothetical protein HQM16_03450 [Deltaproteobacteria bacterium]|nr:hypothetical protein [Deltaproteobacteria bacterium]